MRNMRTQLHYKRPVLYLSGNQGGNADCVHIALKFIAFVNDGNNWKDLPWKPLKDIKTVEDIPSFNI